MRLFIAINFSPEIRNEISGIQDRLRESCIRGSFTLYENLHLTLVFLGEVRTERVKALRGIIDGAAVPSFRLFLRGTGSFKREGGDIWWLGLEENESLSALHQRLSKRLTDGGFELERRKFAPHLTLAREVVTRTDFSAGEFSRGVRAIDTEVSRVSLMKSERINGRLTYTEIYAKTL